MSYTNKYWSGECLRNVWLGIFIIIMPCLIMYSISNETEKARGFIYLLTEMEFQAMVTCWKCFKHLLNNASYFRLVEEIAFYLQIEYIPKLHWINSFEVNLELLLKWIFWIPLVQIHSARLLPREWIVFFGPP